MRKILPVLAVLAAVGVSAAAEARMCEYIKTDRHSGRLVKQLGPCLAPSRERHVAPRYEPACAYQTRDHNGHLVTRYGRCKPVGYDYRYGYPDGRTHYRGH